MADLENQAPPGTPAPAPTDQAPRVRREPPPRPRRKSGLLPGCLIAALIVGLIVVPLGLFVLVMGGLAAGIAPGVSGHDPGIIEHTIEDGFSGNKVAVIRVHGVIMSASGLAGRALTGEVLIRQLRRAQDDPDVIAVVLDMNTPGGEVTATDEVYHALMNLRDGGAGKKVVTCMRSVAASGGYYLAAGSDHIIANRLTWTGSIGVLIPAFNYQELFEEKLGIKSEYYKSGEQKDMLNGARERTAAEREIAQALVDDAFLEFAKIVAKGRNLPLATVTGGEIGDARILTGKQALALGLVDELGYLEQAYAKARALGGDVGASIVRYDLRPTLAQMLMASRSPTNLSLADLLNSARATVQPGRPYYLCPMSL